MHIHALNGRGRGDQYVTVYIETPRNLNREQKEALLALRQQESACLERMQSLRRQLLELLSGPPLEELAALSRSMGMSNDPEVLAFRQQVDRILTMFGAEAFAPAEASSSPCRPWTTVR